MQRGVAGVLAGGLCTIFAIVLALLAPAAVAAGQGFERIGRAPQLPRGTKIAGELPATTTIRATLALQPRDPEGLAAYAQAVATPGSGAFHDYLTVAQFARRFGPGAAQVNAVRAALAAKGLQPGAVSANGLSISVAAPAARLASAFSTSFERYTLPSGRTAFANTAAPAVPSDVAGAVQGVLGLDTLTTPHPAGLVRVDRAPRATRGHVLTGGPQGCAAASAGGYTADRIASAYGFSGLYGAGDLGSGITVALYELEPYSASDVAAYQSCYGTSAAVSNISVNGGAGTGFGQGEAALDIEDVIGLAPRSSILVYEGPNSGSGPYATYSAIVTQNRAKVISTSWGLCEPQEGSADAAAENTLFQEAAIQGQSIFAASGDSGAEDCTSSNGTPQNTLAVDDPASQPYVTGVGGTSLTSVAPAPSQSVWNNSYGAGGGGISALWKMPSYQSGAKSSLSVVNPASSGAPCASATTLCREVPDVSADADPNTGYAIYYSGAWYSFGGTSAAAPTWAALTVLADASSACAGTDVGFANPAIYAAAASSYGARFADITSGSNGVASAGGFSAGLGYDMASGLGSPNASALAAPLCGSAPASTVTLANPGAQVSVAGDPVQLQLSASSSGGDPLTFTSSGLPSGLTLGSGSGLISGAPSTAGSWTASVTARDATGSSSTISFTWSVSPAASSGETVSASGTPARVTIIDPGGQSGRVGVAERLAVSAADSRGLALRFSAERLPSGLSIDSVTGLISGTPRTAGSATVTLVVTDSAGNSAQVLVPWTIAGAPRLESASLSSGRNHRVVLAVRLVAGAYAPGILTVVIHPPAGGSFSRRASDLRRGLRASGVAFGARVRRGALEVKLRRPLRALTLRIADPAIRVRRGALAHAPNSRGRSVRIGVTVYDAGGTPTHLG